MAGKVLPTETAVRANVAELKPQKNKIRELLHDKNCFFACG